VAGAPGEHLDALFEHGRRAWPTLRLDHAAFVARARRVMPGPQAILSVELARAPDLFLAFACAERDDRALAEFDRKFLSRVRVYLARRRKPPVFVEEVTQRLREKLFTPSERSPPRIEEYVGRGSLDGWLRIATVRQALDLDDAERRHRPSPAELDDDAFGATSDPELAYLKQRYLPQFREAFQRAMRKLPHDERNLLRFHLVDGLDLARIGTLLGISRATAGRRLVDCRRKILLETRRELAGAIGATPSEVDSLLRLVRSRFDGTIRTLLTTKGE
jgi:RNA polymerase sigma-70 factor (ECF subfamily)